MRTITTLVLTLFFAQSVFAQNIPYSSSKKYEKVDAKPKKYNKIKVSTRVENNSSIEVKTPFITKKKERVDLIVEKK